MRHLTGFTLATALALHPLATLACTSDTPPPFDGGPETGVSISVGRITDRDWTVARLDGQPVPKAAGLGLSVSFDGAVEGDTGCNRFTGTADLDAGMIWLGALAVTEMACMEPDRMDREAAWLKALGEVRYFIVSPEGLWLTREDGTTAVCLE